MTRLCTDCKWLRVAFRDFDCTCPKLIEFAALVDGARSERTVGAPLAMRLHATCCGPEGKWWEAKS